MSDIEAMDRPTVLHKIYIMLIDHRNLSHGIPISHGLIFSIVIYNVCLITPGYSAPSKNFSHTTSCAYCTLQCILQIAVTHGLACYPVLISHWQVVGDGKPDKSHIVLNESLLLFVVCVGSPAADWYLASPCVQSTKTTCSSAFFPPTTSTWVSPNTGQ